MKIGIDISVLQTPHRMRGIGFTLINFINHMPKETKKEHSFVLYHYPIKKKEENPLELLDLKDIKYKTQVIYPLKAIKTKLPWRFNLMISGLNQLRVLWDIYFGDSRLGKIEIDYFLQFDQNQPLPSKKIAPSALIIYDLIQYVMEPDYFWSYSTARARGSSVLGALRIHYRRKRYISKTKLITKRATKLIAISEHTKNDFVKYLKIKPQKIQVCLLGVNNNKAVESKQNPRLKRYVSTSWGPIPREIDLSKSKFLLFVGGADHRRKIEELVAAFNNLRARGEDIKLVLAGDTMFDPVNVPNPVLQEYFKDTSYLDDIYFLGFIDNDQRDWLYKNALAFVYPSVYEGFGLPILEAMQYGTPVITYQNSSIPEVAGDAVLYANDYAGIMNHVVSLLSDESLQKKLESKGIDQAKKFSWQKYINKLLKVIGS